MRLMSIWRSMVVVGMILTGVQAARAGAAEPSNESRLARWHRGQLEMDGHWVSVDRAERYMKRDERRTQFAQIRDAALEDPSRWASVAKWARRHELENEERLAWTQVLTAPQSSAKDRTAAAKNLGMQQVDGQWMTAKERAARSAQQQALQQADRTWRKKLIHWRTTIEGRSPAQRDQTVHQIREIRDAAVIPLLEELYSNSSQEAARATVEVLADWPHAEASQSLVRHAIYSEWPEVRECALKELKKRPLHDFAPMVIASLVAPAQSQFMITTDRNGDVLYRHQLHRPGQEVNQQLVVDRSHIRREARVLMQGNDSEEATREANRESIDSARQEQAVRVLDAFVRAQQVQQQVAQQNQWIGANQAPVYQLLREVTRQELPDDPLAWSNWWRDYNDRTSPPAPTLTYYARYETVDPLFVPLTSSTGSVLPRECFAAGTMVRTQFGLKPIETIQLGDRVLSQSVETGELTYKLVLASTVRPTTEHCRIQVGDETIVCTWGHPFWLDQEGWRMARHLTAGDSIYTATGPTKIDRIEAAESQEAYNLVVEDFHSYFVGRSTILAHDNTERRPTRARVPGLLRERMVTDAVSR